jgi:hypothetical protein
MQAKGPSAVLAQVPAEIVPAPPEFTFRSPQIEKI